MNHDEFLTILWASPCNLRKDKGWLGVAKLTVRGGRATVKPLEPVYVGRDAVERALDLLGVKREQSGDGRQAAATAPAATAEPAPAAAGAATTAIAAGGGEATGRA